jgi:branched-subunit amino acid aminotransferase/4-amino-4-deoxychorismate lyase
MRTIAIGSPAVAQGLGLFETMLVANRSVALLERHRARMTRSAAALGFPVPDAAAFRAEVLRAAEEVAGEGALRCLWIAAETDAWVLAAEAQPVPARTVSRRVHGRAITLPPSLARALPEHKLTSYAPCVIGLAHAAAAGADEGLFVNREGLVLEGTATNVFAVTRHALVTAPDGVLPGVMRARVLEQADALGIAIEWRCPTRDDLRAGSFLTSSLTLLAPLRTLDGEPCAAPGAIFEELRRELQP